MASHTSGLVGAGMTDTGQDDQLMGHVRSPSASAITVAWFTGTNSASVFAMNMGASVLST